MSLNMVMEFTIICFITCTHWQLFMLLYISCYCIFPVKNCVELRELLFHFELLYFELLYHLYVLGIVHIITDIFPSPYLHSLSLIYSNHSRHLHHFYIFHSLMIP